MYLNFLISSDLTDFFVFFRLGDIKFLIIDFEWHLLHSINSIFFNFSYSFDEANQLSKEFFTYYKVSCI